MAQNRSWRASPPAEARLVGLLAVAMLINYIDRGNLATAAPLIKDQLRLSNSQTGILFSAFFWTYVPCQLLASTLAERITPYRTLALGVALWSVATIAIGLSAGFTALLAWRLVLGIGESATFPCNAALLARRLPAARLGAANGLIGVGQALGPAVGTFFGGLLIAGFGWRALFLLCGVGSALWLLPWAFVRGRGQGVAMPADTTAPAYKTILGRRQLWGASFGHFTHNYSLYFLISWLPLYLVKTRGFSVTEMAELGGLLYIVYAIAVGASGAMTDNLLAAGADGTRVRKTFATAAQIGLAACMLGCAIGSPAGSILALLASGVFLGMNTATIFAIGQILGGPIAAGKWMGVQNSLANLAGIAAPLVTGFLVDAHGFGPAFALAAAIALAGIAGWLGLIGKIQTLEWS